MSPPPLPLPPPSPLAGPDQPVDWMFAFKFNAASFPGCAADGKVPPAGAPGLFGGVVQVYPTGHSQQYVYATSANPTLVKGTGCLGATLTDPLGATFAQIFNAQANGKPGYYYVLWNDQPQPNDGLDAPWGHSKGMAAWNDDGAGFVLQVSTPSWPGSGSVLHPVTALNTGSTEKPGDGKPVGNTLGCIDGDDDVLVSQHFFALALTKDDLKQVLTALATASVATNPALSERMNNGGPADVQTLVAELGKLSTSPVCPPPVTLSSGVQLISKPSFLHAPPWQLVSAKLGGVPLRVASWWQGDYIYSTPAGIKPSCWDASLGTPGAVEIALSGGWNGTKLGLEGKADTDGNHAKLGVSTDPARPWCIFGDENQQGALAPGPSKDYAAKEPLTCQASQNGRGGTFYALNHPQLHASLSLLLKGDAAPLTKME